MMSQLSLSAIHAQENQTSENTWLGVEGGLLRQHLKPLDIAAPVYQNGQGAGIRVSLYYDLGDSFHRGEVSYLHQPQNHLQPADIPAPLDRYVSLGLNYQFIFFHWRNIANLNLDVGSGPYLFVNDQTHYYNNGTASTGAIGSIHYGGGVDLLLRYRHPNIPLQTDLHVVNGGFLGRRETDYEGIDYESTSSNGWFTTITAEVGYRLTNDWRVFISYDGTEQLEYRSPYAQRRTIQQLGFGISYRLEDD